MRREELPFRQYGLHKMDGIVYQLNSTKKKETRGVASLQKCMASADYFLRLFTSFSS